MSNTESSKFAAAWQRNNGGLGLRPNELGNDTPNDIIRVRQPHTGLEDAFNHGPTTHSQYKGSQGVVAGFVHHRVARIELADTL